MWTCGTDTLHRLSINYLMLHVAERSMDKIWYKHHTSCTQQTGYRIAVHYLHMSWGLKKMHFMISTSTDWVAGDLAKVFHNKKIYGICIQLFDWTPFPPVMTLTIIVYKMLTIVISYNGKIVMNRHCMTACGPWWALDYAVPVCAFNFPSCVINIYSKLQKALVMDGYRLYEGIMILQWIVDITDLFDCINQLCTLYSTFKW